MLPDSAAVHSLIITDCMHIVSYMAEISIMIVLSITYNYVNILKYLREELFPEAVEFLLIPLYSLLQKNPLEVIITSLPSRAIAVYLSILQTRSSI